MGTVADLVALLDSDDTEVAESAEAGLRAAGAGAMPAVVAAMASFGRFGKLCAIELVDDLAYAPAAPVLVTFLRDEEPTVREWSADALATLGHTGAVPELRALYARLLAEGEPLDHTGPVAVRRALTALGGRRPVVPPGVAARVPRAGLEGALRALADARQVVLYVMAWRVEGDTLRHAPHEGSGWRFDPSRPWDDSVRESYDAAMLEAALLPDGDQLVDVEWIDQSDLEP